jgi:hypothetical protein
MSRPYEKTTYQPARPTTTRSTQRSDPSTQEHVTHSPQQSMTFQPKNQNQEPNHDAHLGITIRWAARAAARDRFKINGAVVAGGCCGC